MSETSAGSIVATLRLSITDFETNIAKAQGLADKLDGKNVDVQVKVDTAGAETKLAAVAASEDKVDAGNKKVASSSQEAGKGMGLLSMAIVGLGPAIVPLAAGAAGLAVGFGAMGAAGVLAIVGISREMKAGTPLGGAYTTMLGTLSGDLSVLGHTAAAGVLKPFQTEVANLQGQMPALNSVIGEFSVITGKTAGNLMNGLVAAFIALAPLARDVGTYVLNLSDKFVTAMSGPGVVAFGDYIRSVFPQVMQTVESVVTAVVHLVAALAPMGGGTLLMLKTFTDLINAIPIDVLSVLAQGAASVYIGFKTFGLLSVGITSVGTALTAVGVSAETAAVGMRALNVAAGAVGILITIAMLAFTAIAGSTQQATQAANDYTDALIRSNGAIDANVKETAFKTLSDNGAIEAAKNLGLNLSLVTNAAVGNIPATQMLGVQMKDLAGQTGLSADKQLTLNDNLRVLRIGLGDNTTALGTGTQAQKDHAAAMDVSTTAAGGLTTASLLGMNAQQQSESANKSQVATIKTLNAAMDEEISRALNLAGATSNLDQATLTMTTTLKANKLTMDQHTQAGIDDRRAIEGVVGSLEAQRQANIKAGDSTAVATTKYAAASAALLDQTGKMYGTTSQAYLYMKQLLAIPPTVKTELTNNAPAAQVPVDALGKATDVATRDRLLYIKGNGDGAYGVIAGVQSKLDAMHDVTVHLAVQAMFGTQSSGGPSVVTPASGGYITGPGTGTSDSIPAMVSNGEFVTNAAQTAKNLPLLHAINRGQGYAMGGLVQATGSSMAAFASSLNSGMNSLIQGIDVGSLPGAAGALGGGGGGNAANKAIMQAMATRVFGWGSQLGPLDYLMMRESGYNNTAQNPTSTAYGMGQFLDSTWAGYGPKTSDPYLQSLYTLEYIKGRYGDPAGAAAHEVAYNWYGDGGMVMPGGISMNEPNGRPERQLSGKQTESFERLVAVLESGSTGGGSAGSGGADVVGAIKALGDRFGAELQNQARTIQTMQRQMARA